MKFHILTLFPEMILQGLGTSIIGRAASQGLIHINAVNIRDYTLDKHGKVDDYPYGGGAGMLMQAQPVYDAHQSVTGGDRRIRTVYVTPQGAVFNQEMAADFAKEEELIFLCGHYEGIDERVLEEVVTDYVSIGDYVLTGGELPAMVMIDAISRLVPGVLNNSISAETESFHNDLLEYPQYSRPEVWHGKGVPVVLLSGNHKKIVEWRLDQSKKRTKERRPDLFLKYDEREALVRSLSKKKRENIHLMETLKRGMGQTLYQDQDCVLLYHKGSEAYLLQCKDDGFTEKNMEAVSLIPSCAELIFVNQEQLAAYLCTKLELETSIHCYQACYTRKETLPVKHKDIRLLDETFLNYVAERYPGYDRYYLAQRIAAGAMYGAFSGEQILGVIGMHDEGGMGFLYVEEAVRRQGVAASLESFLINRQLEWGFTPYCHVDVKNEASLKLQEKLGLYLSAGTFRWLERKEGK